MIDTISNRDLGVAGGRDRADDAWRVRIEQLRILDRYIAVVLGVHLLVGGTLIYTLWGVLDREKLLIWGLALIVMALVRVGFSYYRRDDSAEASIRQKSRNAVIGAALSGLIWGAAGLVFFKSGAIEYQLLVLAILVGMGAGAVASVTAYMPAFYAYMPASLLPITGNLLLMGDPLHVGLGIMTVVYIGALSFFGHHINRTLVQSLWLRFENRHLIEELRAQKEEAEHATLEKSRFLAAASHDLRQPLHALSLFVDVLKELSDEEERDQIMLRIDASVDALRKLFDALLDISRLDADTITPEYGYVDLADLMHSLTEECYSAAADKGLRLRVYTRPATVVTDRLLLERVLRNIVSNAIRYTDSGGILLSARPRGDMILVQVWDTGIGIPHESHKEIFHEFRQLHNAHRDRSQGLGLGLAIVNRLCRLLNHPLELRSQPGKGSVFGIRIAKSSSDPAIVEQAEGVAARSWGLAGRQIVVIDDEPEILAAMDALLSKWGCDVTVAKSLPEAELRLAEKHADPDLIISDLRLEDGRTGVEAINRLRERFGASIPGILITGETEAEQLKMVAGSGYPILQKPVRPIRLWSAICQYVSPPEPASIASK